MPLPPFPPEFLELPDVELAIAARTWTIAHRLQFMDIRVDGVPLRDLSVGPYGVPPDRLPDGQIGRELATAILYDAAAVVQQVGSVEDVLVGENGHPVVIMRERDKIEETDNVILVGVEKALRLAEPDAQGNVAVENLRRAGGMIRQFLNHQTLLMAALDEAATRRRHQSTIGTRRRPSYLHSLVAEMVQANPDITAPQVIDELERLADLPPPADPKAPRIEHFDRTEDDGKGVIEWKELDKDAAAAPLSGIDDMLSRIRKDLGLSRPKKPQQKI